MKILCDHEKCEHYNKATKYPRPCYYEPQCWRGYLSSLLNIKLIIILISVFILALGAICSLVYNRVSASDAPEAIYCEYNGTWFQFHSDWQGQPQDWDSIGELRAFLEYDNTDRIAIYKANAQGVMKSSCWLAARQLRDNAYFFGKYMETESLTHNEFIMYYHKMPDSKFHMVNKACVYNSKLDRTEVWFIEPQTDRHWYVGYLSK